MKLEGKVAAIIGGARGIGKGVTEALLQKGAKVCIGDILEEKGKATKEELASRFGKDNVYFKKCDITDDKSLEEFFKTVENEVGRLEIFSPTAAIIDEYNWQRCLDINLTGGISSTYEAMKYMRKDRGGNGGVVIMFSSMAAFIKFPNAPIYNMTKGAIIPFVRAWADKDNFAETGVRFNCLCPYYVNTDMLEQLCVGRIFRGQSIADGLRDLPKLTPTQVANAFLLCVENDEINGQALKVLEDPDPLNPDFAQFPSFEGL